ncbi:MAG: S-layer homology domain-containing protein, partial [Halanaerobiales bacterium]
MKKNSIVIAMFLVVALTVSAFAASFADVPANHWAYEAVNKLVAAGLISGYPDGTYRGQNTMTRYEVATILARLLNSLAEMREEMMDQVTFMIHDAVLSVESGLSEAQAEDVQAILQAVIDKNTGGAAEGLTTAQAEEIYNTIADLAREFDAELLELGIRVGRLERRVAALEEKEPEKATVTFSGGFDVKFTDRTFEGQGKKEVDYYFINDKGEYEA